MTDCRPPGVLLIVDVFPPAICGIGDYSACLARAMAARGIGVRVLTRSGNGESRNERVDGFDVRRVGGRWGFADARRVLEQADAMGTKTIVHVQYPSRTGYCRRPMINLLPALMRIVRPSHPVVVTLHEYHEHRLRWRARVLPMLLGQSAVIAVRNADYRRLSSWLRLMRPCWTDSRSVPPVTLVPIASNIPAAGLSDAQRRAIRRELGFDDESVVVVFFGDVRPDKGVHLLLDAAQAVRGQGLDLRLLVISVVGNSGEGGRGTGDGGEGTLPTRHAPRATRHPLSHYEAAVLARIEHGQRSGWATLVRSPEASRVASLLSAADLAVFPFSLGASENRTSLLAATANGLPVLTTRGPSTPPGYEAAYGVATVRAGDHAAMVRELVRLAHRPDARDELRRKAVAASRNQSWDKIAEQTIAVYSKCRVARARGRQLAPGEYTGAIGGGAAK